MLGATPACFGSQAIIHLDLGTMVNQLNSFLSWADIHGSGLAAIAAFVGIPLVLWQIFQGARQERKTARARRYAALASLPMTLAGINDYAKQVAQSLNAIYPWVMGIERATPQPTFDPPPPPVHLISGIEQMIEAAPGDKVGKALAAIVSDIQVLNSRIQDAEMGRNLRSQMGMIDSNLMFAARIYARAEALYDESRALSDDAPVDYDKMMSALNIMNIHEREATGRLAVHPSVHDLIRQRSERTKRKSGWRRRMADAFARLRSSGDSTNAQ